MGRVRSPVLLALLTLTAQLLFLPSLLPFIRAGAQSLVHNLSHQVFIRDGIVRVRQVVRPVNVDVDYVVALPFFLG